MACACNLGTKVELNKPFSQRKSFTENAIYPGEFGFRFSRKGGIKIRVTLSSALLAAPYSAPLHANPVASSGGSTEPEGSGPFSHAQPLKGFWAVVAGSFGIGWAGPSKKSSCLSCRALFASHGPRQTPLPGCGTQFFIYAFAYIHPIYAFAYNPARYHFKAVNPQSHRKVPNGNIVKKRPRPAKARPSHRGRKEERPQW